MLTGSRTWLAAGLMVAALSARAAGQAGVEGYWEGAMARGGAVQLMKVDLYQDAGKLKGKLTIPDLTWFDLPPFEANFASGRLHYDTVYGKATLALDPSAGEMFGTVGDATPPISIHLKRAQRPVEVPVKTEDVQFRNGDVTLAGTLVTPATPGPHPAIVWIHGRGKSGRGQFRGYARIFAQRGVASLIYDKRGVGQSTGDHDKSGMNDFAGDARAALELLAASKDIDARRIGLHGSSAGGWVAPIVATRAKVALAFIITDVGPAESVRDQQVHVVKHNMRLSGINFTAEEVAAAMAHESLVQDFAYTGKGWEALQASVARAKPTRWARFVDLPESETYEDIVWVRLNQYDPAPDLRRITIPFLAIYGERDFVVPPAENVKKLEQYLTEAGNRDFKIVVVPEADHSLLVPNTLRRMAGARPEAYYWGWRKAAPGLVETKIEWLLKRVTP